jgi:hypothetical protein
VWSTACLMAYEAVRVILGKPGGPGPRGLFVNPWTYQVERPRRGPSAWVRRWFVRRFLDRMAAGAGASPAGAATAPTP